MSVNKKEEIMLSLLDNLFEREYGWRETLPSGNTPSKKANKKLSDLSRNVTNSTQRNKPINPNDLKRIKKIRDQTKAQSTIVPPKNTSGPSSSGGKAQKPKDSNTLSGSLSDIVAAKRNSITKDGERVTTGGENAATSTGGRYNSRGRGKSGGAGGTIRNKAVSSSGVTHHGVRGNQHEEALLRYRQRINEKLVHGTHRFPLSSKEKELARKIGEYASSSTKKQLKSNTTDVNFAQPKRKRTKISFVDTSNASDQGRTKKRSA